MITVKTIYIVMGATGEYEDFRDWNVKAFSIKELAEDYAKECTVYLDELMIKQGYKDSNKWYFSKDKPMGHPLDEHFDFDYTGNHYRVQELKYEEECLAPIHGNDDWADAGLELQYEQHKRNIVCAV